MSDVISYSPMYRMPVVFGPSAGPRQGPNRQPFDWRSRPQRSLASVSFLTDAKLLARHIPPGCELDGEPVVAVEIQNWTDLPWLNGRGYNTLGVKIPVRVHDGKREYRVAFLAVIWENMPDAILTGREELGYNKLFADLPAWSSVGGGMQCSASWFGHRFCTMRLDSLVEDSLEALPVPRNDGVLNWKYVPGTGYDASPDANYLTLSPPGGHTRYLRLHTGVGSVIFHNADWSQMPTQHHIVEALAGLPQLENRDAFFAVSVGARDLSDMVRLDVDLGSFER